MNGRIAFGGDESAELQLMGSLRQSGDISFDEEAVRIIGTAGNNYLTLDECLPLTLIPIVGGITLSERYLVHAVFLGAQFAVDELLHFRSVTLKLEYLDYWVNRMDVSIDIQRSVDSNIPEHIQIEYSILPTTALTTDVGELKLEFPYKCRQQIYKVPSISQDCQIRIDFDSPYPLDKILKICSSLRNLVTIAVHSTSRIKEISLGHDSSTLELGNGRRTYRPIEYVANWLGMGPKKQTDVIYPHRMIFTFDDLGGLDGVASWLRATERYEVVLSSLVSHWYMPNMYTENRFFNMTIAAEAMERIRQGRGRVNFKKALKALAYTAGTPFSLLVGDVNGWSGLVTRTRNSVVVHPGLDEKEDPDLFVLSESLYWLVMICLLKECGVSEQALSDMQDRERFRWLMKGMEAV